MDLRHRRYTEKPLVKTKIIATVGPACWDRERLTDLIIARLYVVLDSLSIVLTKERDVITNLLQDGASAVREVDLPTGTRVLYPTC